MVHVASIVHVTDLHLFVNTDGSQRSPSERGALVDALARSPGPFAGGLDTAHPDAVLALETGLPRIVRNERSLGAEVIVAQTGDVEALGLSGSGHLPGYAYLHGQIWPALELEGATCIDVYGNHDIWPGSPPMISPRRHNTRHVQGVARIGADWSQPYEVVTGHGLRIRVHRVNTVREQHFRGGVLAQGGAGPHPPKGRYRKRRIAPLVAGIKASAALGTGPALHVVVCHHPPHLFRADAPTALTTGVLTGAAELGEFTAPVSLVVAGHRHKLDPIAPTDATSQLQSPLRPGAGQLVAESPTQLGKGGNSIAVYRLQYDSGTAAVDVDRLRYEYTPASGLRSRPIVEPGLLSGLAVTQEPVTL